MKIFNYGGSSIVERVNNPSRNINFSLKNVAILFCFGFLFFGFTSQAGAATYYVAKTGSDSNTTTQAQNISTPWLTLAYAEKTATDGDTINVSAGTYVEDDATYHGWYVSKAIAWNATGTVIVKGTGVNTRPLIMNGVKATIINGFTIDAEGTRAKTVYIYGGSANKTFNNVTFLGATNTLIYTDGIATNITVTNSTLTNSTAIYTIYGLFPNLQISHSTFNIGGTSQAFTSPTGTTSVTFDNNNFNLTSATAVIFTFLGNPTTVTFTNNVITGSITNYLFFLYSNGSLYNFSGNTITLNTSAFYSVIRLLDGSGSPGTFNLTNNNIIVTSTTNAPVINANAGIWTVNITGNTFSEQSLSQLNPVIGIDNQVSPIISNNTIETLTTGATSQIRIKSSAGVAGGLPQVIGNTLRSRNPTGYVIEIGTEGTTVGDNKLDGALIEGNTIYGALYYDPTLIGGTTHAIFYGFNKNGNIRYNRVYGDGYGLVLKGNGMVWSSGGVYYNSFVNNAVTGILCKGVQNTNLYNNTIYTDNSISGSKTGLNVKLNVDGGGASTNTVQKNNIINSLSGKIVYIEDTDSTVGFISDHNHYYPLGGTNIGYVPNMVSLNTNFSNWQAAGLDTHGVYADPLFTDTSNYNFVLRPLSQSIDSGTTTSWMTSTTTDFSGNPIYGTPDIGAYEYQPPYTITTDHPQYGSNIRIYGDGKYRYTTATTSSSAANLSVTPVGGYPTYSASTTRPEYLNISDITWGTSKQFTASSSIATSTIYTIGDLTPNTYYTINYNHNSAGTTTLSSLQADQDGKITFTYTGGYSTVLFDISPVAPTAQAVTTPTTPSSHSSSGGSTQSQVNNLIAMGNYTLAGEIAKQYGITMPSNTPPQVPATQNSTSSFTRDLKFGMKGLDVKLLQQFLNNNGFPVSKKGVGSKGRENTTFGPATKAALIKFQKANKIPSTGFFGVKTRSVVVGK